MTETECTGKWMRGEFSNAVRAMKVRWCPNVQKWTAACPLFPLICVYVTIDNGKDKYKQSNAYCCWIWHMDWADQNWICVMATECEIWSHSFHHVHIHHLLKFHMSFQSVEFFIVNFRPHSLNFVDVTSWNWHEHKAFVVSSDPVSKFCERPVAVLVPWFSVWSTPSLICFIRASILNLFHIFSWSIEWFAFWNKSWSKYDRIKWTFELFK